eukprot:COSAG01_NODE_4884_length_4653_cov_20.654370_5_plen_455_part_00
MVGYLARAAVVWFAFTGNRTAIETEAVPLARYLLANGTTPKDWVWPRIPYASSDPGALIYRGANSSRFGGCEANVSGCRGDGIGHIEPDKAADAARGYAILANVTGDASFKSAAVAVADTLARLVRSPPASSGTRSPWPFRVAAQDGSVVEEYTSNVVSHLRLFDMLIGPEDQTKLTLADGTQLGRTAAYVRARRLALAWQQEHPMRTGAWTACCEDVPIDNSLDNYNAVEPMYAAQYLIEKKVPGWQEDAASLLAFVEQHLIFNNISNEPAIQYGARAVSEQKQDHNKMGCHTARYAHTVAMFNEAVFGGTNESLTDIAFRSYNWASYMVLTSGLVVVGPAASNELWFRIQLAAFMDMLTAMRYMPHWPPVADHLFEYSCSPTHVTYATSDINYIVSCAVGREVLKVTFQPKSVTAGGSVLAPKNSGNGYWYDTATGLLVVEHSVSGAVHVVG